VTTLGRPPGALANVLLEHVEHPPLTAFWADSAAGWMVLTRSVGDTQSPVSNTERVLAFQSGEAVLTLRTPVPGVLELSGTMVHGDGVNGSLQRPIESNGLKLVTNRDFATERPLDGRPITFRVPAEPGRTVVTMTLVDATQDAVFLQDLRWNWRPTEATIMSIDNPNGLETYERQPFFWIGQGKTTIRVRTRSVGELRLSASFLIGPSLPSINVRRIRVATDTGYEREVTLTGGDGEIVVPALRAQTFVTLTPQDKPSVAVLSNKDTRPLLLGVKGIRVELHRADGAR
jgi:hypothetical protein